MAEGERLVWLRAWTKAEPFFREAERAFAARGDRRNALYAAINALRGQLPRLPVPQVSQRLADYLEDPVVLSDDRLKLRTLIIKAETDEDLDPELAEHSWNEALAIADKLPEKGWANRARGELGLVAFLLGDINTAIIRLGQAMKVAETTNDVASLVRWLTLFGHGYVQLDRSEQALDFYDRALKLASTVPELQFPLMTYLGKGNALARLGRLNESKQVLADAFIVAERQQAYGYQAELLLQQGVIAHQQDDTPLALEALARATALARKAGGNRILAEIALELARIQRAAGRLPDATVTLRTGIATARDMGERLLLPRLLAELAEVRIAQFQYTEARSLLEEAGDQLEGLLANASSPWVRSRVIGGMDGVLVARVRLEGLQGDVGRLFSVLEQARGRSLLELVATRDHVTKTAAVRAAERQVAALQLKLLRSTRRADRQQLLDDILRAEERLAPAATEVFTRTRVAARRPVMLRQLQQALRSDEVFLEFVLAEPHSFAVIATRTSGRIHRLAGRTALRAAIELLSRAIRSGDSADQEARRVGELLLDGIPELGTHSRVIMSPDAELHQIPLDVLITARGGRLLQSHVVSSAPSGSILVVLRNRVIAPRRPRAALAVGASPDARGPVQATSGPLPAFGTIARGVYDLDATQLRPLPSANDEARAVVSALGESRSTLLVAGTATEEALRRLPLHDYGVLHFAAHGILSTKFPARSAILLRPAGTDDGLVQAREILEWRVAAELVTLSACDTGAGTIHGQDGVSNLVRPFLAAGARSVVANLWTADDKFSLALMREFYGQLAAGFDVAGALRGAKLRMLEQFGPEAVPKLWSGVLVYGDGAAALQRTSADTITGGANADRR